MQEKITPVTQGMSEEERVAYYMRNVEKTAQELGRSEMWLDGYRKK